MPPFTRKRDHGTPDPSWWNSTPTTGPTGTATTWVGIRFDVTLAAKLTGTAFYDGFADPATHSGTYGLAQLCEAGFGGGLFAVGKFQARTVLANAWNFIWFHPQPILTVGTDYLLAVLYPGGGFFRNNAVLPAGGTTRNNIHFQSSFQSTALDLTSATLTLNTNANAIDPIIRLI